MSNYIKGTDFAGKDSLETGNPAKIVKGAEIDDEFNAIAVAVNSKANTNSPALTGIPTAPTATTGTNNTQLATTAFVNTAISGSGAITAVGDGLTLSGTTVSHDDTSSQASVDNSGNTFIQDITLDTFGHITAITSGTVSDYTAPDPTTAQVLAATAGATKGAVGTYALCLYAASSEQYRNVTTAAGSNLRLANAGGSGGNITSLSGTWQIMGEMSDAVEDDPDQRVSLWLRTV